MSTESARLRSIGGVDAELIGVIPFSLKTRSTGVTEHPRKEASRVHMAGTHSGGGSPAAYVIDWLDNLPVRPFEGSNVSDEAKAALTGKLATFNAVDQRPRLKAVMSALGLELGGDEDVAWRRRNKAAHGTPISGRSGAGGDRDMKLLRGLFNRLLLRITNAADEYIDYTPPNFEYRPLRSAPASAIATLEQLAPGRLMVGFGTGFTGRAGMGKKPLTLASMRTHIAQVKALLRGDIADIVEEIPDGLISLGSPAEGLQRPAYL